MEFENGNGDEARKRKRRNVEKREQSSKTTGIIH